MRLLHTADWHLGKRLYQAELVEDHQLFFSWLVQIIRDEKVDALLVSGDVFDSANPANESRRLYYQLLVQLSRLHCQVIITGGNHDSPAVLNAPKDMLKALNIHVIGGQTEEPEEMIVPLLDAGGNPRAIVAAIPYLRDNKLRQMVPGESYDDRREAIRAGIARTFDQAAECCRRQFPGLPAIAMGHLFVQGASVSESERDIQIGNLASFDARLFHDHFKYIALGHIHKPQEVNERCYYAGAPMPFSFSERQYEPRAVLFDLSGNKLSAKSIAIPVHRSLIRISGTIADIKEGLQNIRPSGLALPSLIEVEMEEEYYDPQKIVQLESLIHEFTPEYARIIKYRISFSRQATNTAEMFDLTQRIEDLDPKEVFDKRMSDEEIPDPQRKLLSEAFEEVLQMIQEES